MTSLPPEATCELNAIAERYGLSLEVRSRVADLAALFAGDKHVPTTVRDPLAVLRDHIADSLEALTLDEVLDARTAADLGSGAGVPALPLALARPGLHVTAVESVARKARFIARAAAACGADNVTVLACRAEEVEGRGGYDLVTARALASPEVVAEYAAPLLRVGGSLIVWRGRRDPGAEAVLAVAAAELGLEVGPVQASSPYPGIESRHLHVLTKVAATPARFPRRPGIARKRPLGHRSDRSPR